MCSAISLKDSGTLGGGREDNAAHGGVRIRRSSHPNLNRRACASLLFRLYRLLSPLSSPGAPARRLPLLASLIYFRRTPLLTLPPLRRRLLPPSASPSRRCYHYRRYHTATTARVAYAL